MSKHNKSKKFSMKEVPLYKTGYWLGKPEKGFRLIVFDKAGKERSRLKLNEFSARSLRDSLNVYLGEEGA